jgi:tetratricopeptide (TPR) repeat protein
MEALGPHGLAVIVDLIDAIALGSGGIHIVVTDRADAVRAEIEARCPAGWGVAPLFAPERDRLSSMAHGDPEEQGVLLLDIVEPGEARELSAIHALNDYREWLLRRGIVAVVIVAGKDARRADAAYLELQAHAPDFWSVRNRVHRVVGPDLDLTMKDELLDVLAPRFGGDRAAAAHWLDGRNVREDWIAHRLWREGPRRDAWLDAVSVGSAANPTGPTNERARFSYPLEHVVERPTVSMSSKGRAIAPERWPQPAWPSGWLDATQQSIVEELGAAVDRDGAAELHVLPEDPAPEVLTAAVLTLGLLRQSRYGVVLHLDARKGLEDAIATCLRDAGETEDTKGLIDAARRLQGALGSTDALLLVVDASPTEFNFLHTIAVGRTIVATVRGDPTATFGVAASPAHADQARWMHEELSAWSIGATMQWVRPETAALDLRAALSRADHLVVLVDSTWNELPQVAWKTLEAASHRVAAFEAPQSFALPDVVSTIPWYGPLGPDDPTARERLRHVARAMAGEPIWGDSRLRDGESPTEHPSLVVEERIAVERYRRLAQRHPDDFLPKLSSAFKNLVANLHSLGRREDALRVMREAVEAYRQLAELHPDASLHELAGALGGLGVYLHSLGRREQALRVTRESVELRRALAEQSPEVFRLDLAQSLANLGIQLDVVGRREEALRATRESIELYRWLVGRFPKAFFASDLAKALWILGLIHLNAGDHRRALDALVEGSRIIRPIYEESPAGLRDQTMSLLRSLRLAATEGNLAIPGDLASWADHMLETA